MPKRKLLVGFLFLLWMLVLNLFVIEIGISENLDNIHFVQANSNLLILIVTLNLSSDVL